MYTLFSSCFLNGLSCHEHMTSVEDLTSIHLLKVIPTLRSKGEGHWEVTQLVTNDLLPTWANWKCLGQGQSCAAPSTQGVCPVWTEVLKTPHNRQPPSHAIHVLRRVTQFVLTVTCLCHQAHWTDEDTEAQSVFGTCTRSHCWEGWSSPRGGPGLPFACCSCGRRVCGVLWVPAQGWLSSVGSSRPWA